MQLQLFNLLGTTSSVELPAQVTRQGEGFDDVLEQAGAFDLVDLAQAAEIVVKDLEYGQSDFSPREMLDEYRLLMLEKAAAANLDTDSGKPLPLIESELTYEVDNVADLEPEKRQIELLDAEFDELYVYTGDSEEAHTSIDQIAAADQQLKALAQGHSDPLESALVEDRLQERGAQADWVEADVAELSGQIDRENEMANATAGYANGAQWNPSSFAVDEALRNADRYSSGSMSSTLSSAERSVAGSLGVQANTSQHGTVALSTSQSGSEEFDEAQLSAEQIAVRDAALKKLKHATIQVNRSDTAQSLSSNEHVTQTTTSSSVSQTAQIDGVYDTQVVAESIRGEMAPRTTFKQDESDRRGPLTLRERAMVEPATTVTFQESRSIGQQEISPAVTGEQIVRGVSSALEARSTGSEPNVNHVIQTQRSEVAAQSNVRPFVGSEQSVDVWVKTAQDIPEQILQQVGRLHANALRMQASGNTDFVQRLTLNLHPEELGQVEVQLRSSDQVSISFNAREGATRDLLDAGIVRLRQMFEEQGINLGEVDVGSRFGGDGAGERDSNGEPAHLASAQSEPNADSISVMDKSIRKIDDGLHVIA